MKNISDFDFRRVSSFVDGELEQNEVKILLKDMSESLELKGLYFKMIELGETSQQLKPIGFKKQLANLSLNNLLGMFAQKIVLPITIFGLGTIISYSIFSTTLNFDSENNKNNLLIQEAISSIEAQQTLENIRNDEILQFASRHYAPTESANLMPVAYQPKWIPTGYRSDEKLRNKFINSRANKGFSIFINDANTSNLPDGIYKKGNFILVKKTLIHDERSHAVAIFGDIDVESGKKILDSIELVK